MYARTTHIWVCFPPSSLKIIINFNSILIVYIYHIVCIDNILILIKMIIKFAI